jgi:murein L,D-transpeptidase YcbB/YkuD
VSPTRPPHPGRLFLSASSLTSCFSAVPRGRKSPSYSATSSMATRRTPGISRSTASTARKPRPRSENFSDARGLKVDGIVGPATAAALNLRVVPPAQQLLLSDDETD